MRVLLYRLIRILGWLSLASIVGFLIYGYCIFAVGFNHDAVSGHLAALQYLDGYSEGIRQVRVVKENLIDTLVYTHTWHAPGYQYFTYLLMRYLALPIGVSVKLVVCASLFLGLLGWCAVLRNACSREWLPWFLILSLTPIVSFASRFSTQGVVFYNPGTALEWAVLPWLLYFFFRAVLRVEQPDRLKVMLLSFCSCSSFALKYSLLVYAVIISGMLLLVAWFRKECRLLLIVSWAIGGVVAAFFLQIIGVIDFTSHIFQKPMPAVKIKVETTLLNSFQSAAEIFLQIDWFRIEEVLSALLPAESFAFGLAKACYSVLVIALLVLIFFCSMYFLIRAYRERTLMSSGDRFLVLGVCTVMAQGHLALFVLTQALTRGVEMSERLLLLSIFLHLPILAFLISRKSGAPTLIRVFALILLINTGASLLPHWEQQSRGMRLGWSVTTNRDLDSGLGGYALRGESDQEARDQLGSVVPPDAIIVASDPAVIFDSYKSEFLLVFTRRHFRKFMETLDALAATKCAQVERPYVFVSLERSRRLKRPFERFLSECAGQLEKADAPALNGSVWLLRPSS